MINNTDYKKKVKEMTNRWKKSWKQTAKQVRDNKNK